MRLTYDTQRDVDRRIIWPSQLIRRDIPEFRNPVGTDRLGDKALTDWAFITISRKTDVTGVTVYVVVYLVCVVRVPDQLSPHLRMQTL